MSNWSGGVLTAAGRALQAKVEAGTALELTCLKVGDGAETAADVDSMTNLLSAKKRIGISSVVPSDNVCKVTGILSSADVSVGFYARELGLFAQDPDVGEILYMIALDSAPDYVPPQTSAVVTSAEYAINVVISNSADISIHVDPNGLATIEMLTKAARLLERSTTYQLDDTVYETQLRPGFYLKCTTPGTTGTTLLDLSSVAEGDTVSDGTVVWTVSQGVCENDYSKTSFGTSVINHLLGSTLASLISAVSTDSVFSKLLKLAMEAAGLRYSMGTNGYICLGALFGNLILQWGIRYGLTANTQGTITLPIAYSSASSYRVSVIADGGSYYPTFIIVSKTSSVITIKANAEASSMITYMAIGY